MKRILQLSITLAAAMVASATAWAQTSTTGTSSSAGVLSSSTGTTSATGVRKKPTSATADMINEAIQRSEARAAAEAQTGKPQQWGSEEPFAYNPTVKRFDKSMQ